MKIRQKNKMSPELVELWAYRLTVCTAVFGAIAAGFGLFALYFTNRDANYKADSLKRFQAESQEKTAKLENTTALARLELEKLKLKQIPRTIDPTSRAVFIRTLFDALGSANIIIATVKGSDGETIEYAKNIFDVFKKSNHRFVSSSEIDYAESQLNIINVPYGNVVQAPEIPRGIIIEIGEKSPRPNYIPIIEQITGPTLHRFNETLSPNTYRIIVGSKPDTP